MSTSRQRMLDAFHFTGPDRIPVVYHPSPAGLYVHGRKLLDLFERFPPDNSVVFDRLPQPPPGTIDAQGRYHEVSTDAWGTTWEYLIFGLQGHPKAYPFPNWEAARDYVFPEVVAPGTPTFAREQAAVEAERRDYLVFRGWVSLFEKLHALRPMDEVLMDLLTEDPGLMDFLDRLEAYWHDVIAAYLAQSVDVVVFGDDWGGQTHPLVSTRLFRRLYRPRYEALMAPVKAAGRKVFFHSCGYLGPLFDELLDLGVDGVWPQITRYDEDAFVRQCRAHGVATYLHPDRQRLVPLGTPAEIEAVIRRYAERYHALGGGAVFYVEMENDAPFENVEALLTAIDRYR